ncbi:hypothetical protein PR002_g18335 [Phytophthora rubi]|uniref:DDE-1 domain-containing protein n=1 Tax=Phytophthora rubi TaxID=129364 RepID=A0A6A3K2Q5_9STRA|nr:hypothetical protein PR002_g18335 [Phytophthora rubi]
MLFQTGIIRSFKARYRRRFVRWCLDAIEGGIKRKLNLLEAIQFSIESWGDVSADCIRNCWVKSRIVDAALLSEIRQAGEYAIGAEEKVVDELASMLKGISGHSSVSDYLAIDSDTEVHEQPDIDCENNHSGDADSENETEELEQLPVSAATALAYCMELSSFFFQCEEETKREQEMLQTLTALARAQVVKRRRQTSLDSFFAPR